MKNIAPLLSLVGAASAHFHLNYPTWRDDSLELETASQWMWPCANISEHPAGSPDRTAWPLTGGSLNLTVGHEWAYTYVNLGMGNNISSFNVSLVEGFNQTGNGTFCLKETGRANLEAAVQQMGISIEDLDGRDASIQVIQISHSGASLYNCADITFRANATLLSDEQCQNSTNVGGVALANADASTGGSPTESGSPQPTGAGALLKPAVGGSALAALAAVAAALL